MVGPCTTLSPLQRQEPRRSWSTSEPSQSLVPGQVCAWCLWAWLVEDLRARVEAWTQRQSAATCWCAMCGEERSSTGFSPIARPLLGTRSARENVQRRQWSMGEADDALGWGFGTVVVDGAAGTTGWYPGLPSALCWRRTLYECAVVPARAKRSSLGSNWHSRGRRFAMRTNPESERSQSDACINSTCQLGYDTEGRGLGADLNHAGSAQIAMPSPSRSNHLRKKEDKTTTTLQGPAPAAEGRIREPESSTATCHQQQNSKQLSNDNANISTATKTANAATTKTATV